MSPSARHIVGMAQRRQSVSHFLAEQAVPGNLSGPESRAGAAHNALWAYRSNSDRTVGWTRGPAVRRGIHPCVALGDFGPAAALPRVPPFARRTGSHRQSIANISGMVRRRIGVLTWTRLAARFRARVQLFPKGAV